MPLGPYLEQRYAQRKCGTVSLMYAPLYGRIPGPTEHDSTVRYASDRVAAAKLVFRRAFFGALLELRSGQRTRPRIRRDLHASEEDTLVQQRSRFKPSRKLPCGTRPITSLGGGYRLAPLNMEITG